MKFLHFESDALHTPCAFDYVAIYILGICYIEAVMGKTQNSVLKSIFTGTM